VAGTAAVKFTPLSVTAPPPTLAGFGVPLPVSETVMSLNVPVALLLHAFVADAATAVRRDGPTMTAAASANDSRTSKIKAPRWWLRMIDSPWCGSEVRVPTTDRASPHHDPRTVVKADDLGRTVK
jgi:hypothetical protein